MSQSRDRRVFPGRIRFLLLMVLSVALAPVLLVQAGIYYRWLYSLHDKEVQENIEVARAMAIAFDSHIRDLARQELAVGTALVSAPGFTAELATRYMVANAAEYPSVRAFSWADPQGHVSISSDPRGVGVDIADREYFRQALSGPQGWVVSDLFQSRVDGAAIFAVARCIRDPAGKPVGVMVATIDPRRTEEAILQIKRFQNGGVVIMDSLGRLVCRYPQVDLSWQQRAMLAHEPPWPTPDRREVTGSVRSTVTGQRMAAARVLVGDLGWVAGAGRPVSEVMAPVWEDLLSSGLVAVLATAGSVLLAVTMSRRISSGIGRLREHAIALDQGDPGHRTDLYGITELCEVAEALNQSAARRREAEESLRRASQQLRFHVENSPLAVIEFDADLRISRWTEEAERLFGWTAAEVIGKGMYEIPWIHEQDREQVDSVSRELQQGIRPRNVSPNRNHRKDGGVIHCEWYNSTLLDSAGRMQSILSLVLDVTDRKRAEQGLKTLNETLEQRVAQRTAEAEQRATQLRALAGELARAEQRERKRLAQILHDHLQQLLVGAKFNVRTLQNQQADPGTQQGLQQVNDLLDESLKVSRSLTADLSPPILHAGGFVPVLDWLARQMEEKHGLCVQVQADADADSLVEEVRVLLYQAVRELLFNVVKHAQVRQAAVRISHRSDGGVQVVVADAGCGFEPTHRSPEEQAGSGFGLLNIRERLALMGGCVEIHSAPGQGTRIALLVPASVPAAP